MSEETAFDPMREMQRHGDWMLDVQNREHQTLLDQAASMMTLSFVVLGGATAAAVFYVAMGIVVNPWPLLMVAGGISALLVAFVLFGLSPTRGFLKGAFRYGLDLQHLVRRVLDDQITHAQYVTQVMDAYPDLLEANAVVLRRQQRLNAHAALWFCVGLALAALGLLLSLAGPIVG